MDPQKGEMTLIEIARARGLSPVAWDDRYIASKGAYQYMALSDADLKMFSESDIEALDKVYEAYGSMDDKELSDLSPVACVYYAMP